MDIETIRKFDKYNFFDIKESYLYFFYKEGELYSLEADAKTISEAETLIDQPKEGQNVGEEYRKRLKKDN